MGRIVIHPGAEQTPLNTLVEVLDIAQGGRMVDCIIMFTDADGKMHLAWSRQSNADLAAAAVVLQAAALDRLTGQSGD